VKDIADKLPYQEEEVESDEDDAGPNVGKKFSFSDSEVDGLGPSSSR
jgi:hypothetical protein